MRPAKERERTRRDKSRPIVNRFFEWCDAEFPHLLDESPIQDALRYARNQRIALQRFLDDGRLSLNNNLSELNLRRQVVGRKSSLFLGGDDGAFANVTFVSLLASARLHGIEPHGYLRGLLCLIRAWPRDRVLDLAPPTGSKLSSSPKLSRSWPLTSSDASRFRRRADLAIAQDLYAAAHRMPMTGETERIRSKCHLSGAVLSSRILATYQSQAPSGGANSALSDDALRARLKPAIETPTGVEELR